MGVIWNAYQAETSEVLDDQPSEEHRKRVYDWFRNLRASEPRPLLGVYRSARQTAASANLAIGERLQPDRDLFDGGWAPCHWTAVFGTAFEVWAELDDADLVALIKRGIRQARRGLGQPWNVGISIPTAAFSPGVPHASQGAAVHLRAITAPSEIPRPRRYLGVDAERSRVQHRCRRRHPRAR